MDQLEAYKKILDEAQRDLARTSKAIVQLKEDKDELAWRIALFKETDCPEMFEEEMEEFGTRFSEIEAEILGEEKKRNKFQKIMDHLKRKHGLS